MSEKSGKQSVILVPVDFSPDAEAALVKACELADCMKASIKVLHVVHDPGDMPGYYSTIAKKKYLVRIEDTAQEMMDEFVKNVAKKNPDIKCLKKAEKVMVVGIPVTRILQVADKENTDMIVMGSKGRTGLTHYMLGSKAEQVVRLANAPVLIVKAPKK